MNATDPFSKLLQGWRPSHPDPAAESRFVEETMRRIRLAPPGMTWEDRLTVFLEEWLPSPNAFLPVAASLVVLLAAFQWAEAVQRGKSLAALRWHQDLSQPTSKGTLSGSYARLVME
ncbi:MAG: hypothetical protein HY360_25270 [Verrucomicrobia bacterium]|nr:hypothetical protein [Verrucomicrobiota bacterium]